MLSSRNLGLQINMRTRNIAGPISARNGVSRESTCCEPPAALHRILGALLLHGSVAFTAWRRQLLANRFAASREAVTIQTFPPTDKLEIGVFSWWVAKLLIPPAGPYPVNLSGLHSRASQRGAAPQPSGTHRTVGQRTLPPHRLRAQGVQAPSPTQPVRLFFGGTD